MMSLTRTALMATTLLTVTLLPATTVVDASSNNNDVLFHSALFDFGVSNQTVGEAFRDCVCWNTTSQNWCHHATDGPHDGLFRLSCQRVMYYNYWWAALAVVWMVWLGLAPVLMCIFRLLCNCCGGRNPSYGCCCPYSSNLVSPYPKFTRPYSRCATYTAKLLALLGFAAVVTLSVHSIIATSDLGSSIDVATYDVSTTVSDLGLYFSPSGIDALRGYATTVSEGAFGSAWFHLDPAKIAGLTLTFTNRQNQVLNAMHKIRKYKGQYFAAPVDLLVSVPLALVTLVTVLAMCNKRGWFTSISAGLLSFMTIAVVVLATVLGVAAIAGDTVCNNVESVEQFAVDVLSNAACDLPQITDSINATQIGFADMLCDTLKMSELLDKNLLPTENICAPQGRFTTSTSAFKGVPVVNQTLLAATIQSGSYVTLGGLSIGVCSQIGHCAKLQPEVRAISEFYTNYSKMLFSFGTLTIPSLYKSNFNCSGLRSDIVTSIVPSLCPTHHKQYTNPSLRAALSTLGVFVLSLAIVFTLLFWVWMNGSKRFAKGHSHSEMIAIHHDFGVTPEAPLMQPSETPPMVVSTDGPKDASAQPLLLQHVAPAYDGAPTPKVQPELIV